MRERAARGREALELRSELLQRIRLADPSGGVWEAADVQWWWRRPRASDNVSEPFWLDDDDGPVAGVLMTSWRADRWQCDPVVRPDAGIDPSLVWARSEELIAAHARGVIEVNLRDDDATFTSMVTAAGCRPAGQWTVAWMDPKDRPAPHPPAAGFTIVDRSMRQNAPHPMAVRNGPEIAIRLSECPLYDAELDLAVISGDGRVAGYSLYWYDSVTRVGCVEPMRVDDVFHRRGLATAMLGEGIDRLVRRGAQRIKVGFADEAGSAVYRGVGFTPTATVTCYEGVA